VASSSSPSPTAPLTIHTQHASHFAGKESGVGGEGGRKDSGGGKNGNLDYPTHSPYAHSNGPLFLLTHRAHLSVGSRLGRCPDGERGETDDADHHDGGEEEEEEEEEDGGDEGEVSNVAFRAR